MALLIISAIILVLLSALFSASESAFLASNKLRVRFLRDKGNKRAIRTSRLLEDKERLLNTLLVSNELVNIALSVIITMLAIELFGSAGVAAATGVVTLLLLVFGEITPKCITTRYPESFAFAVSGIISALVFVMTPFVAIFTAISRFCLSLFGMKKESKSVSFTEEEIKTFLDVGSEEGVLDSGEKKLMNRVFKFNDLAAVDIMIPRRDIVGVSIAATYDDIVTLSRKTRFSRFPVYRRDLDDIVGVLYIKDLLPYAADRSSFVLGNVLRPPLFILGTKKMTSIQQMLIENRQTFAVVIDEYSGTDGILTSEDISREIFGDFADPDKEDFTSEANFIGEEIDGSTRLSDLEDALGIKLISPINETIAGFICERLGRIPEKGEFITEGSFRFTVNEMDSHRIAKVLCEKI